MELMSDDTIDLESVAESVTESVDPISPQPDPEKPFTFTEDEAQERENFVLRALAGGRRDVREKPRNSRKPRATKPETPAPPMPRKGNLAKQITQLYISLGTFLMPFDTACAGAIINAAPDCGEAMENLARENPAVRKAILAMVETSVWGQVVVAHAPIMLAIAIHHVPAVRNNLSGMAAKVVASSVNPDDLRSDIGPNGRNT